MSTKTLPPSIKPSPPKSHAEQIQPGVAPVANNYIYSLIDRLCDKLWAAGVTNPISYVEQISYLFFLKMLDETEIEKEREAQLTKRSYKSIFAGAKEAYRWSKWQHITEPKKLLKFVRDDVFNFMSTLLKATNGY